MKAKPEFVKTVLARIPHVKLGIEPVEVERLGPVTRLIESMFDLDGGDITSEDRCVGALRYILEALRERDQS